MDKIDETSESLSALSASDLFQVKTSGDLPSKPKHTRTLSKSSTSSSNDLLNDQLSQSASTSKNPDSSQSGASDDEADEKQKFECYHLMKKAVPGKLIFFSALVLFPFPFFFLCLSFSDVQEIVQFLFLRSSFGNFSKSF